MKIPTDTVQDWIVRADTFLAVTPDKDGVHRTRLDTTEAVDAWAIAHRTGMTREAYADRTVTDAHIKTALQRVFPNCVFKDRYHY